MTGGDTNELVNLLDLSQEELGILLEEWGEPSFRVKQVWKWLYQRMAAKSDEMTDLPKSLRVRLDESTVCTPLTPRLSLDSTDGNTSKVLFELPDGEQIEAVLMHYERRHTVCISTQVGCGMVCAFCATGLGGLTRNLSSGEIVAQVLFFARQMADRNQKVTNVVFMGMGEPLANYEATWSAVRRLNDPSAFGLGARAMTISTIGLVPAIYKMSQEPEQVGLAVSLHAATDELRNRLVPVNRQFPLFQLMKACRDYVRETHRRVTFEYAIMRDVNDSDKQAHQLADLIGNLLAQVNIIPLNPVSGVPYYAPSLHRVQAFQKILEERNISVTVRLRRGTDIQAGCGQLRSRDRD